MKTIKIFLASSEEMDYDRQAFGNLVRRLDDIYEKRGIRVKLFEWEDYDSAYNDRRKQDEYNDKVKESDVFLALFHRRAGSFTVEEFNIASEQFRKKASPKVYAFLRDLKPEDKETPELAEFKKRLFEELGHFWCRYNSRDSLRFQFVMQLQLVESSMQDDLKLEGSDVTLDGVRIASMDKLSFAAGNEEYVKMSEELSLLPEKIEKARLRLEKLPEDEDLQDDLQQKLNRYNDLKKSLEEYRQLLFETAKRVAKLQTEKITDRLRRAMDAFNEGKVREANIILDEAEVDAKANFDDYKKSRELTEQYREKVAESIKEMWFKTSVVLSDATRPIEDRQKEADGLYSLAIEMASEVGIEPLGYARLLSDYGSFLIRFSNYDKALEKKQEATLIYGKVLGIFHPDTATLINDVGVVYHYLGDDSMAQRSYSKALEIRKEVLPEDHPDIARSLNNLGGILYEQENYSQALEYDLQALAIYKENGREDDPFLGEVYNNIGTIYCKQGDNAKAWDSYNKALVIREKLLGKDHTDTAATYSNIGALSFAMKDYPKALEYSQKALAIRERAMGTFSRDTADSYENMGLLFHELNNDVTARELLFKALRIREKLFGKDHPGVANSYFNIGILCRDQNKLNEAKKYFQKSLKIREKLLVPNHRELARSYLELAEVCVKLNDYSKAFPCFKKALRIYENKMKDPLVLANDYFQLGRLYKDQGNLSEAQKCYEKSLGLYQGNDGSQLRVAENLSILGAIFIANGEQEKAKPYLQKAIALFENEKDNFSDSYYRSFGGALLGWGVVQQEENEADAKATFEKALEVFDHLGDSTETTISKLSSLNALAILHAETDDMESANHCIRKALSICETNKQNVWVRTMMVTIMLTLTAFQKHYLQDVGAARETMEKVLSIIRSLDEKTTEQPPSAIYEAQRNEYLGYSGCSVEDFLSEL